MASNQQLKLIEIVGSPFETRAEIALNLKGVEYEYMHESSLENKSDLLIKFNPVHKKVPMLITNDKPIYESLVIAEYVDEAWIGQPILPSDPYERAQFRFCAKLIDDKVIKVMPAVLKATSNPNDKERGNGAEKLKEALTCLQNELKGKFFNGDSVGFLDIAALFIAFWLPIIQEAAGLDLYSGEKYPKLEKWGREIMNHPLVKGVLPPRDLIFAFFVFGRYIFTFFKARFQGNTTSK